MGLEGGYFCRSLTWGDDEPWSTCQEVAVKWWKKSVYLRTEAQGKSAVYLAAVIRPVSRQITAALDPVSYPIF